MAINALSMGVAFTARDLASGVITKLSTRMKTLAGTSELAAARFTKATGAIKSGAVLLGAGVIGLLALNRASKAFETFEVGLVTAGNVMNATEADLKNLSEAAIQAGIKTQFSPTEAIEGLRDLGAAGLNAATAIKVLNPVLDLAAASLGQLGVAQAGQIAVGVLNAFGETADKASKRVDQLVRITQLTNFQARDFSVAISQASAQAKIGNQTFESMIATLGLLRNVNLDASSAATAYREAVRRVSGDQGAINKLIKLGVQPIDEQTKKMKDLGSIIAELAPKLQDLSATQKGVAISGIFGARGMKVFSAFMASHTKLVKEGKIQAGDFAGAQRLIVEELNNSSGAAEKAKEAFLKTAAGQRVLLKGSIETFKVLLGETITPVLLPAIKSLVDALNKIIGVFRGIPGPVKDIMANFVGLAAAGAAVAGTIKLMSGAIALLGFAKFAASATVARAAVSGMIAPTNRLSSAVSGEFVVGQKAAGAATKSTNSAMRTQGRLARFNKTALGSLGKGVSALGRALPLIAVGVAVVGAAWKTLNKDQAEIDAARKKRLSAIAVENKRTKDAFIETAKAAVIAGEASERAAEKLLKMSRSNAAVAQKSLAQVQATIRKQVEAGRDAFIKLIAINERLQSKDISLSEAKRLNADKRRLRGVLANAEAIVNVQKVARLELEAEDAKKRLRTETNEAVIAQLRAKFAAGRLTRDQKLVAQIKSLEKSRQVTLGLGQKVDAARLAKSIANLQKQRAGILTELRKVAKVEGIAGAERISGDILARAARFGPAAFAKRFAPAVEERARPPTFLEKAGVAPRPTGLPAGITTAAGAKAFRELAFKIAEANLAVRGEDISRAKIALTIQQATDAKLAELVALQRRGSISAERPLTVVMQVDGKKLGEIVSSRAKTETTDAGGNVVIMTPSIFG